MYPTKDLIIKIVDGQKAKGVCKCHKFFVQIQDLELQIGFYTLPLGDMDRHQLVDVFGNLYRQYWKEIQGIIS